MSKGPDLSAFPIPRKGGAKPIAMDEAAETAAAEEQRGGEGAGISTPPLKPIAAPVLRPAAIVAESGSRITQPKELVYQASTTSGQMVATTVKLDESRYLRLTDAGKPSPGRLRRRTIQDIMVEALDEWFERRGL
jgi:hypothetical protein